MKPLFVLLAILLAIPAVHAQICDEAGIHALIDRYAETEAAGDMRAQARLMADDRVWIAGGMGRMTNQAMNMEGQQAWFDVDNELVPGMRRYADARDRMVRCYGGGDVAVASFYWYQQRIPPATMTAAQAEMLGDPPRPSTLSLVLERQGSDWRIVHTHSSPLWPPGADN